MILVSTTHAREMLLRWKGKREDGRGLAPADGKGDVEGHRASLQQDRHPVAVFEFLRGLLEVRDGADLLAIDLPDDVAALDAGRGGRALVVDADNHDALGHAKIELAGHF